ncbi:MAG: carbohydrate-binding domain-containing protein [Bacilli bacterium]|jgi:hypothetical protein|nr:carbohydrate-binding domain-containing protein [Bacilli bacterium]
MTLSLSAETAPETYDAFPEDGHITKDGNYLIEGTTTTGIEIDKSLTVHLFLKNAVISSTTGSSLFSGKKAKVTITAMEGTTNSVTNAVADVNAIHIKGTLYLNGKGTLSVASTTKGGIKSSGYLGMKDIHITVSSVSHAISGEEIYGKDVTVIANTSEKDGIHAEVDLDNTASTVYTYDDVKDKGYVRLVSATYTFHGFGDAV